MRCRFYLWAGCEKGGVRWLTLLMANALGTSRSVEMLEANQKLFSADRDSCDMFSRDCDVWAAAASCILDATKPFSS